jgi:hypothetical protein
LDEPPLATNIFKKIIEASEKKNRKRRMNERFHSFFKEPPEHA